ncbi:MAG: TIGR00645 family protein [Rhodoferax sp.]|nr:TIGR00645 family protein [Rhodoferax sp.]
MTKTSVRPAFSLEELLEKLIFASRWLLVPFYLGLVLALLLLAYKFAAEFLHFGSAIAALSETDTLLGILGLIDKTLLGNLLILVIFSGYENFVSLIGVAQDSPDRPRWMGDVDFAGLKLKLIGSIVALSGINLLGAFLNLKSWSSQELGWMVGIHLTFVITGVLFALSEKIGHGKAH